MNLQNFRLQYRNKISQLMLLVALMLVSCGKDSIKPLYTNGVIKGNVTIENEIYYNGIEINAYGPYGTLSTQTDSSGNFTIKNIPNGTYRIEYSKNGYGTVKSYGHQIFSYDTIGISQKTIYKKPLSIKVPVQPTIIRYPDMESIEVNDVIIKLSENNNYMAFFDTHQSVSWLNYQCMLRLNEVNINNSLINQYKKFNFKSLFFKKDTKIYLTIYSFNPSDQGYLDPIAGIMVFPTINPDSHTNVITLTMP